MRCTVGYFTPTGLIDLHCIVHVNTGTRYAVRHPGAAPVQSLPRRCHVSLVYMVRIRVAS